jgi:hypothetical protein
VFDIRDPVNPRQIAYYIPPAFTYSKNQTLTGSPDSGPASGNGAPGIDSVDRCSSKIRLGRDAKGSWDLWVECQENEFQVLRFTNGVFPLTAGYALSDRGSMASRPVVGSPAVPNTSTPGPVRAWIAFLCLGLVVLCNLVARWRKRQQ